MRRIVVKDAMTEEESDGLLGAMLGGDSFDVLIGRNDGPTAVYRESGELLVKYLPGEIPDAICRQAYGSLLDAAKPSMNRGAAAGELRDPEAETGRPVAKATKTRVFRRKGDGTVSKTNEAKPVESGIIGSFDRNPRFPFCRLTVFNMDHPEKFRAASPFLRRCSEVFEREEPERYAAQKAICEATHPDWIIPGTVFTTVTVNKNWQTAVHKDAGDYKPGIGVMSVLRAGEYDGHYLVFPRWRVAVDMSTGGVCLADVHQWHGNTPVIRPPGKRRPYVRLSTVLYYREKMKGCLSIAEEGERAKRRQAGTPMYED